MKIVFNLFITEQSIFDASHTSASSNGAIEHITIHTHTMTGDIMSPSHHYINLLYASVIYMHEPSGTSSKWIDDSVDVDDANVCSMHDREGGRENEKERLQKIQNGHHIVLYGLVYTAVANRGDALQ